jgi:uncharacterized protein
LPPLDTAFALAYLKSDPVLVDGGPPAELITTHMSWVLRSSTWVVKLKRPVSYDFADYSTIEARHKACLEELRLNSRLAPDVYVGLLSLHWEQGRPCFQTQPLETQPGTQATQPGTRAADYAVLMRRLKDEDALSVRLVDGTLSLCHLEALATRLAHFYTNTTQVAESGDWDAVAGVVRRNFQEIRHLGQTVISASQVELVAVRTEAILNRLKGRLLSRVQRGAIRDGHGDLRLEHVYFEGQSLTPIIIDCVEFEPAFRHGDLALDAAFFAMELELADRGDLAAYFWSCLARSLQDYSFYPLIDFYVSYRAAVRSKVAALVADAADTQKDKRLKKGKEALALWGLAERASLGLHPGCVAVVCVGGLVGAGKSSLADALIPLLRGPSISSDRVRKSLAGIAPTQPGSAEIYGERSTALTLATMLSAAEDVLASGRPVILDATFRSPAWRGAFRELAKKHRAPFLFVEARCNEAQLRERLRGRETASSVSDARETHLEMIAALFEPPIELPASECFVVHTDQPIAPALIQITKRLFPSAS